MFEKFEPHKTLCLLARARGVQTHRYAQKQLYSASQDDKLKANERDVCALFGVLVALLNDSEVLDPGSAQRMSEGVMYPNKSCAAEEHALGQKEGKRFLSSWRAPANPDLAIA
jgi:hypothetical protein